jgi:exo-beta-1,3-glucanase (GH17 family)
LPFPLGNAICYSGYRRGQSPNDRIYPSVGEIREDLQLLRRNWRCLRLYDCSEHAVRVLSVIRDDRMDFQVMLGAYLAAEVSNPNCPWGGSHEEAVLAANRVENSAELHRLVELADAYRDIVFSVAVGNEATVDWTDHLVPVPRMVDYLRWVRPRVTQPVTFCENHVPWLYQIETLVPELDFISLHSYPVWEYKSIAEAIETTRADVDRVRRAHPGKPIVITEAGWTTASNGRGIPPGNASPELQAIYCRELMDWSRKEDVPVFVFEAFDEPWKGSPDPLEPEKHWGLFTVDRRPKPVIADLYPELAG